MIPDYSGQIFNDLFTIAEGGEVEFTVLDCRQAERQALLQEQMEVGTAPYPLVAVNVAPPDYSWDTSARSYTTVNADGIEQSREFDYKDMMPACQRFTLTIVTMDKEQTEALENHLLALYDAGRGWMVDYPPLPDEKLPIKIQRDPKKQIERSQGASWYRSVISLICVNSIAFPETYHPLMIFNDKAVQMEVFRRCAALEKIMRSFNQEMVEQGKAENQIVIDRVKGVVQEIEQTIRPIHTGWAYTRIYRTMVKNDCDALTAQNLLRAEAHAKVEKAYGDGGAAESDNKIVGLHKGMKTNRP